MCEAALKLTKSNQINQSMTTTDTATALTNLLDAETPEDVHEILDDACRALCDGLRETSTSSSAAAASSLKTIRLEKNARKIREKLRLTDDADVRATMEACETVVREAVWAIAGERPTASPVDGGEDEKEEDVDSSFARASALDVESKTVIGRVSHDRLRHLLVQRVLHRVDKWRAKVTAAAERPTEVLDAFDWSVRVVSASSSGERGAASCAAAARLRLRGESDTPSTATTSKHRILRFDVPRHALDDIVAALADARDAARRAFPSSSST